MDEDCENYIENEKVFFLFISWKTPSSSLIVVCWGWLKKFSFVSPSRARFIFMLSEKISQKMLDEISLLCVKRKFFLLDVLLFHSHSSWLEVKKFAIWFVCRTMVKWISFSHEFALIRRPEKQQKKNSIVSRWWDLLKSEEMSINYSKKHTRTWVEFHFQFNWNGLDGCSEDILSPSRTNKKTKRKCRVANLWTFPLCRSITQPSRGKCEIGKLKNPIIEN